MKFDVFQLTHQGGRAKNEDRMGYCHTSESVLLLLADGMGGHPDGDKASQIAIQTIAAMFEKEATPALADVPAFLEAALLTAHRQILRYAIDRGMPDSPRTTLVAAVIQNGEAQWAHCGDSRLYLLRDNSVFVRTKDHSYSELRESLVAGIGDVNRNVLFTCLGSPSRPIYDISAVETLEQNDRLLLCSDGVWGPLNDRSIADLVQTGSVEQAGTDVVEEAFRIAGKTSDNITIVLLEWQAPRAERPLRLDEAFALDYSSEEDGFTTTISGELLNDFDIERSLDDISNALKRGRKF